MNHSRTLREISFKDLEEEPYDVVLKWKYHRKWCGMDHLVMRLMRPSDFMVFSGVPRLDQDNSRWVRVCASYRGDTGTYAFSLRIEPVFIKDHDEVAFLLIIEQAVHPIFDEVILQKILPGWLKVAGFERW